MRQYYDVYSLLASSDVQAFIGTQQYIDHKNVRFPKVDLLTPISQNEAFLLSDVALRAQFIERYKATEKLYYKGQPPFEELLSRIRENINYV